MLFSCFVEFNRSYLHKNNKAAIMFGDSLVVIKKNGAEGSKYPMLKGNLYKLGPGLDCHIRFPIENFNQNVCNIAINNKGTVSDW